MEANKTLDELLEPFHRWVNGLSADKAIELRQKYLKNAKEARARDDYYGVRAHILSACKWHRRYREKLKLVEQVPT